MANSVSGTSSERASSSRRSQRDVEHRVANDASGPAVARGFGNKKGSRRDRPRRRRAWPPRRVGSRSCAMPISRRPSSRLRPRSRPAFFSMPSPRSKRTKRLSSTSPPASLPPPGRAPASMARPGTMHRLLLEQRDLRVPLVELALDDLGPRRFGLGLRLPRAAAPRRSPSAWRSGPPSTSLRARTSGFIAATCIAASSMNFLNSGCVGDRGRLGARPRAARRSCRPGARRRAPAPCRSRRGATLSQRRTAIFSPICAMSSSRMSSTVLPAPGTSSLSRSAPSLAPRRDLGHVADEGLELRRCARRSRSGC